MKFSDLFHIYRLKGKTLLKSDKRTYKKNKEQARVLIKSRLDFYNQFYNFNYNRVSIKNLKSRWGSCSSKKNLNFNYKLIFLPLDLIDYTIVHELCHLKQFNHSNEFWKLVAETIPDHKERRRRLINNYLHMS
jgi:predicted metal-dependent hydrolase